MSSGMQRCGFPPYFAVETTKDARQALGRLGGDVRSELSCLPAADHSSLCPV